MKYVVYGLVALAVFWAVFFVIRHVYSMTKGGGCGRSCNGCGRPCLHRTQKRTK